MITRVPFASGYLRRFHAKYNLKVVIKYDNKKVD